MSFKEFYNKYVNWIVIVLICLAMIKGCQSCTRKRQVRFNEIKTEQMSNSLNITIDSLNRQIDSLNKVISLKDKDIEYLKATNESLETSNKYYRNTNNTLINTNKKLTDIKDTIK